jgi:hypothetical protein
VFLRDSRRKLMMAGSVLLSFSLTLLTTEVIFILKGGVTMTIHSSFSLSAIAIISSAVYLSPSGFHSLTSSVKFGRNGVARAHLSS